MPGLKKNAPGLLQLATHKVCTCQVQQDLHVLVAVELLQTVLVHLQGVIAVKYCISNCHLLKHILLK